MRIIKCAEKSKTHSRKKILTGNLCGILRDLVNGTIFAFDKKCNKLA